MSFLVDTSILTRLANRADARLAVLDHRSRGRARQIATNETFSGHQPILMTVEQESLCWLGGRLADNRHGETWPEECRGLTVAELVTADGWRLASVHG
ncbi:MAG TPA: hypothetical protein VG013_08480 [Gemmataceae bacterium]|nr:hypothetical protein [Gemmataceae bacterium]